MVAQLDRLLADDWDTALALLADSGVYQLLVEISRSSVLEIGKIGLVELPRGAYLYTGSARRGLYARLSRHLRHEKKLRWHIDYLLRAGRVAGIRALPWQLGLECHLNLLSLSENGVQVPVRGFGASDCCCPAHLLYLGAQHDAVARTVSSWTQNTEKPARA